ncbi:MAG: hypothetical protein U5K75_00120 [Ahrensia sp.]|nr:hypothetical protein [Ahrensia sp.]
MAELIIGLGSSIIGGAASAGSAIAGTATTAALSGLSLSSILQGTATVLGVVSSISAGNADAAAATAAAQDAGNRAGNREPARHRQADANAHKRLLAGWRARQRLCGKRR